MTARPTDPLHDALPAEERELAARLARLDASTGPSSTLDARILAAAARAAAAPPTRAPSRSQRRWPGAVGAAAVLVAAVGLAWQLRPMFQLPPPVIHSEHAGDGKGAGADADTVVQVETVPRRAAPVAAPAAATGGVMAQPAPAAAARKAAPAVGGGAPRVQNRAPTTAARASAHDLFDEAVPPPAPPPPPPPVASAPEPRAFSAAPAPAAKASADAASAGIDQQVEVTGSRVRREAAAPAHTPATSPTPDVSADARLPTRDWLTRIRARRDAGDVAGARASLARFVIAHPRVAVPTDLRPLLPPDDPWSP